jgi:uncharacterized protein (DUF305 family)
MNAEVRRMTTSYTDPKVSDRPVFRESPLWKIVAAVLAATTVLFIGLYLQERENARRTTPAAMSQQHEGHMVSSPGKPYDLNFIDMMIPHHQGAIDEARQALQQAEHPELKEMARNIIRSQREEIEQMRAWRQQWYGTQQ